MGRRQTCRLCGRPDKFDFSVPDEIWSATVSPFVEGVVCLFCFDALAEMRGVSYADSVKELWFAGDKATFRFVPTSVVAA